jgi:phosphatidylglycerophosphate synthase
MADQPPARPKTLAQVRNAGQNDRHLLADPTYARVAVRRISPYVTFLITRFTPLPADAVTGLSIAAGVAGGMAIVPATVSAYLLAVVLLQLAYLLDVVDGEVARVRGTSSLRGTYLDLAGHFIQNRALYGAAGYALMVETHFAPWAIALALLGVAFASPFGEQARLNVTGRRPAAADISHGRIESSPVPSGASPLAVLYWLYRRVAFLWNYPASMNLFCLALLADAGRLTLGGAERPLVLPVFAGLFAATLAGKQLVNAVRILGSDSWTPA